MCVHPPPPTDRGGGRMRMLPHTHTHPPSGFTRMHSFHLRAVRLRCLRCLGCLGCLRCLRCHSTPCDAWAPPMNPRFMSRADVHRIGRTGRAGAEGESVTFWNPDYDKECSPALVKIAKKAGQAVPDWLAKYESSKANKLWAVNKAEAEAALLLEAPSSTA